MMWTRVEHDEFGHPDPATLPPDGARIAYVRHMPDSSCVRLVGIAKRRTVNYPGFPPTGDPGSWESAQIVSDRTEPAVFGESLFTEPEPTAVGDYWTILPHLAEEILA